MKKMGEILHLIKIIGNWYLDVLTCCPGSPWWAAGHCQPPGPHCHWPGQSDLWPALRCLPFALHCPRSGAGNCITRPKQRHDIRLWDQLGELVAGPLSSNRHTHLTAKIRLRSSITLLSLFCSSLRKSLASTLSWKTKSWDQYESHVMLAQSQQVQCVETHIFASHGLKHLLQLDSELLDVIDDDTWLWGGG